MYNLKLGKIKYFTIYWFWWKIATFPKDTNCMKTREIVLCSKLIARDISFIQSISFLVEMESSSFCLWAAGQLGRLLNYCSLQLVDKWCSNLILPIREKRSGMQGKRKPTEAEKSNVLVDPHVKDNVRHLYVAVLDMSRPILLMTWLFTLTSYMYSKMHERIFLMTPAQ